jgi:hypothetical protein
VGWRKSSEWTNRSKEKRTEKGLSPLTVLFVPIGSLRVLTTAYILRVFSCLAYSLTLKIEAVLSSKMSANIYQIIWCHTSENNNLC